MDSIGERVKARRLELGMERQQDLAVLVGVNQSVISDIERGAGFRAKYVMALARALKWSPEQLLEGVTEAPVSMTKKMHELIIECASLSEEDMTTLIRVAQGMRQAPKPVPGASNTLKSA